MVKVISSIWLCLFTTSFYLTEFYNNNLLNNLNFYFNKEYIKSITSYDMKDDISTLRLNTNATTVEHTNESNTPNSVVKSNSDIKPNSDLLISTADKILKGHAVYNMMKRLFEMKHDPQLSDNENNDTEDNLEIMQFMKAFNELETTSVVKTN